MVYRGKPSAGCGACRARKVKVSCSQRKAWPFAHLGNQCDQTRPACNRCVKSNRTCPGYRDQLSLLFRDESRSVAQKANANLRSANRSSSNNSSPATTFDSLQVVDVPSELVTTPHNFGPKTPSTCWEVAPRQHGHDEADSQLPLYYSLRGSDRFQAACFFFNSYSWVHSGLMQDCDLHGELPPSAPMGKQAMIKAMISAGMASLSNLHGSQPMRIAACREYSQALQWTNRAISDRKQATEDTTLGAILCLTLFEVRISNRFLVMCIISS